VNSLVVPERKGHEDWGQTTIMIYKGAADLKYPGDMEIINAFKAAVRGAGLERRMRGARTLIEAGHSENFSEAEEVLGLMGQGLRAAQRDAVERTNAAIIQERDLVMAGNSLTNAQLRGSQGAPEPVVPSPTEIAKAAEAQYKSIFELAENEMKAAMSLRERR